MTVDAALALESLRELRVLFERRREVLGALDRLDAAADATARHRVAFELAMRHGAVRALGFLSEWSAEERARWLDSAAEDPALGAFAETLLKRVSKPLVRLALAAVMPGSFPIPDAAAWGTYRAKLRAKPDEKIWGDPSGVALRGLWVPPAATHYRVGKRPHDAPRGDAPPLVAPAARPVDDALARAEALLVEGAPPGIVFVVGSAGMGKSSFAQMLADRLAARDDVSPVLLRLRDLDVGRPLLDELERRMVTEGFSAGRGFLDAPRVVLLLDGFDELGEAPRAATENFFLRCRELTREGHLHAVMLTGRDTLLRDGSFPEGAEVLTLQPFDDKRIRAWGANWRRLTGVSFETSRFVGASKSPSSSELRNVATHPLLLYMLARLEHSGKTITLGNFDDEALVYRTLIERCCERHQDLRPDDRWKARDMRRFLRAAGFATMARRQEVLRFEDLSDAIRALGLETHGDPARFDPEHTLLAFTRRGEASQTWEFAHRSFGEFLAAEQLAHHCLRIVDQARDPLDPPDAEARWRLDLSEATREWLGAFGTVVLPESVERYLLWMLRGAGEAVLRTLRTRLGDVYRELIDERDMDDAIRVGRAWSLRPTHVHGCALANLFFVGGAETRFRPEEVYPDHFLDAYHAVRAVTADSERLVFTRVGLQGIRDAYLASSSAWREIPLDGIDASGCDLRGIQLNRAGKPR